MVSVASNEILVEEEITKDAKVLVAASGQEMLNGSGAVCMQEEVTQRQVEVSADVTKSAVTAVTALPGTTECSMCTSVAELCENESLKEILDDRQPISVNGERDDLVC